MKPEYTLSERCTRAIGSPTSMAIHTLGFAGIFALKFAGIGLNDILLILTTAVSLEAIYLAIFIQMTVNRHSESLEEVEEDLGEIQGEVKEIGEDIEEISEEVEENTRSLKEVEEDLDEIQDDVEDLTEETAQSTEHNPSLEKISQTLQQLVHDLEYIKKQHETDIRVDQK